MFSLGAYVNDDPDVTVVVLVVGLAMGIFVILRGRNKLWHLMCTQG